MSQMLSSPSGIRLIVVVDVLNVILLVMCFMAMWYICSLIAEQYDVKVSVNDIIVKVVAAALRNVPEANGK